MAAGVVYHYTSSLSLNLNAVFKTLLVVLKAAESALRHSFIPLFNLPLTSLS